MPEQNVVFIIGVSRSGTSLLQSMLDCHSDINFAPETSFLRRYLVTRLLAKTFSRRGEEGVVKVLSTDSRLSQLGLSEKQIRTMVRESGIPFYPHHLYLAFLRFFTHKKGNGWWLGDRDPLLIEFLPSLKKYLPHAVIIHIIRDPRDVLAAKKRASGSGQNSVLYHVFANRVQLKLGRTIGKNLFGSNYHEVDYRRLLLDPERELAEVCNLLSIKFQSSMLLHAGTSMEIVAADKIDSKMKIMGPLAKSNTGRWLKELADWEIDLTEIVCREALDTLAYNVACRKSRTSIGQKIYVWFVALGIVVVDPCYRFYRQLCQRFS